MDSNRILKMEDGTLYLKIHEEFDSDLLEIASIVAKITRDEALLAFPGGTNLVSLPYPSVRMLAEGISMVEAYWSILSLPHRHVLFSCGCSTNWDEYWAEEDLEYDPPEEGKEACCEEHDEVFIVRFNKIDFQ